jgi:hypothetical protein
VAFAALPDQFLSARQQLSHGLLAVGFVLLGIGPVQLPGKHPGAGDIQIGYSGALAGLGHPVAALEIQLLDRVAAVTGRLDTHIDDHLRLGPNNRFLGPPLAFPATGRA